MAHLGTHPGREVREFVTLGTIGLILAVLLPLLGIAAMFFRVAFLGIAAGAIALGVLVWLLCARHRENSRTGRGRGRA